MTDYKAETDKLYEIQDKEEWDRICTLKGLPESEYLCYKAFRMWKSDYTLHMSPDVREPILRYDVYKIEIPPVGWQDPDMLIIEDGLTIERILSLRATGEHWIWLEEIERKAIEREHIRFYFDLPCKLTFDGMLFFMEDGTIYWQCYSVADGYYIYFDITPILEPLFADT